MFPGHLLNISKIKIKYKTNFDKDKFLQLQYIEYTNFKINFSYLYV
jgi:hypothetical protein